MEFLDILWVAVPAAACGMWWWILRSMPKRPDVVDTQFVHRYEAGEEIRSGELYGITVESAGPATAVLQQSVSYDALVVDPPKPVTMGRSVRVTALLGEEPIDGVGWLSPKGEFIGNGPGNHFMCAFRILDPTAAAPDPARNYELELEEKRYAKLIKNAYYYGWPQPRHWRLSRTQLDIIVHWHVMHEKKMPEWLAMMFAGV
jgi:hypothetical protein